MKNQNLSFIALIGLSVVFGIVSFALFLSKGKNKYFLKKKLAIGAAIITLTSMATSCRPVVTCYAVAAEPELEVQDSVNDMQHIVLQGSDNQIDFDSYGMYYENLSFKLLENSNTVELGDCQMIQDSTSQTTGVRIALNPETENGLYTLNLYSVKSTNLNEDSYIYRQFDIELVD